MDEQAYILAQDIGIYSCKAVLYTLDGRTAASNTVYYRPVTEKNGRSTQSPALWWKAFCTNCRTLLHEIPPHRVRAVCLCGQMMACLPVDKDGEPLCDSVTWDDRGTQTQAHEIAAVLSAGRVHQITGVCLSQGFSLSKLLRLKQEDADLYEKASKFIQCKDYINHPPLRRAGDRRDGRGLPTGS